MTLSAGQNDSPLTERVEDGGTDTADALVITGRPRRAPAAAGVGIPADEHAAYRRGICVDCKTAWHAPGQPRCDLCHEDFVRRGRPTVSAPVLPKGRGAA